MTDDTFTPPFGGDDQDRTLPEHEYDENDTVGGGVMGAGGTAVDRGTGTLTGDAQGDRGLGDDDAADGDDVAGIPEGIIPGMPTGGAQPYTPAVADRDDDGGALPDA